MENYWIGNIDTIENDFFSATVMTNKGELQHVIEYPLEDLSETLRDVLKKGDTVRMDMDQNSVEVLSEDNTWIK